MTNKTASALRTRITASVNDSTGGVSMTTKSMSWRHKSTSSCRRRVPSDSGALDESYIAFVGVTQHLTQPGGLRLPCPEQTGAAQIRFDQQDLRSLLSQGHGSIHARHRFAFLRKPARNYNHLRWRIHVAGENPGAQGPIGFGNLRRTVRQNAEG